MKLAVSTYSLARWRKAQNKTLENTIDWIAQTGVAGVEFSGLDERAAANPVRRAAQLRKRVEKHGLAVAGYSVPAELIAAPEQQRQVIERLKRDVDVAAALGCTTMRHDVTRGFPKDWRGPSSFSEALKIVAPAIREVTAYARDKGVKTSLENHGFYVQASTRVEKLIKTVNDPNYGLTMDMGNFLCVNEDPIHAVERCAKYAIMVHTKDFHVRPKKLMPPSGWFATPTPIALRGAIVGHGEIDIRKQLKILKKHRYNHFLSLEFEGMEDPLAAVTLGLEYLRRELAVVGVEEKQ